MTGTLINKDWNWKTEDAEFYLMKYVLRLALLVALETSKYLDGQKLSTTLFNIALYIVLIAAINTGKPGDFIYLALIVFDIIEVFSWSFIQTPITHEVISSLNVQYIIETQLKYFILVLILFLILVGFAFQSFSTCGFFTITLRMKFILLLVSIPLLFTYIIHIKRNYDGENSQILINKVSSDVAVQLHRMIEESPKIIKKKPKLKNLIILQLESMERIAIRPDSMPYLFNLTQKYLYYDDIIQTMYTAHTASGTLITQCGVPQIVIDVRWPQSSKDSIGSYKNLSCLTDYLHLAGYKCETYGHAETPVHGINDFLFNKFDSVKEIKGNDPDIFDHLVSDYLPKYNQLGEKQNFMTLIRNVDTHFDYEPKKKCKPENPNALAYRQMHNCFDQEIRRFVELFFNLRMDRHTVLVMYPDHIMMKKFHRTRRLFMLFPGFPKGKEKSQMTYYDVLPTLLEAVGITQYEPGTVFGASAFSSEAGTQPSYEDFNIMFQFFSQALNINHGSKTFVCRGKNSTSLCNFTVVYI